MLAAASLIGVAAPAQAAPPAPPAPPAAPEGALTLTPDPSYQGEEFEGWGTSLVWFANATGDYPDEIRNGLAELVFGPEGLNLNIARYNIGGGNAPDVKDYLRPGGAVEGWWNAPEGTTREDTAWWDPEDPADWNLEADATQRWWIDRIKQDITHWETFSNSPPYFQTVSGYVSGGFNSTADQLKPESISDFNAYLVRVTEEIEKAHGIEVDTLDPFNEPNTNYWSTRLGADGNPTGGRQEGAHLSPQLQQQVLRDLATKLETSSANATISAMDETNPGLFATNWNSYPEDVRNLVDQLNVHTYGTDQRTTVRDIAKAEDKPLWMSEVEGSWGDGQSFTSMEPGLGMAKRITDDLRELEPTAWVFWQPVEDYDNMKPGGESAAGANWGSIQMPFDCTDADTLESCPIYTNTKFNTVRNYTHYIQPGDRLVGVNDEDTTAAVTETGAAVVHINESTENTPVVLDFSKFGSIAQGATVIPVVSDANGALVESEPVAIDGGSAVVTAPAESVTTFVVEGVSGIAEDAAAIQDGHVYRLQGVQSGKSIETAGGTAVISTSDTADTQQLFRFTSLGEDNTNQERYSITTLDGASQLADEGGAAVIAPAGSNPRAEWIASTTGDGTYTFVNAETDLLLEVGGGSTAEGAPVTLYLANSGANQRWTLIDETVLGVEPATAFTVPGTAPVLPETVTPVYRDGARGAIPVTWSKIPNDNRWKKPGTVTVTGTATDNLGNTFPTEVVVTVDKLVSTQPARAKTVVNSVPTLPATVTAVGSMGGTLERPVTWNTPVSYSTPGIYELTGQADAGNGTTLPAIVLIKVTERAPENIADDGGTTATATFTERGYGTTGLFNGNLQDKAWSNWKPSNKNLTDTLTVNLRQAQPLSGVKVHFFRDGSSDSYAQTVQLQVQGADGQWSDSGAPVTVPAGAPAPVVTLPINGVTAQSVRVVMTARSNTHMVVSEIEVLDWVPVTSVEPTLSGISINNAPVPGFSPDTMTYSVQARGKLPTVTATATDPYSTLAITQPTQGTRTAVIEVTSEDGTTTTTYRVDLTK
ncbi:Ig-like domain-containing protein [Arthrobacter sp. B0490]|uniref:Ig-like domain-containing protein n=1 Tax=Arthrobacter sp. B0490 TaxID=2058891 RepID=UPI002157F7B5|nr:Ig-like domain-containing protein [Arthrobacter sp. B0490]